MNLISDDAATVCQIFVDACKQFHPYLVLKRCSGLEGMAVPMVTAAAAGGAGVCTKEAVPFSHSGHGGRERVGCSTLYHPCVDPQYSTIVTEGGRHGFFRANANIAGSDSRRRRHGHALRAAASRQNQVRLVLIAGIHEPLADCFSIVTDHIHEGKVPPIKTQKYIVPGGCRFCTLVRRHTNGNIQMASASMGVRYIQRSLHRTPIEQLERHLLCTVISETLLVNHQMLRSFPDEHLLRGFHRLPPTAGLDTRLLQRRPDTICACTCLTLASPAAFRSVAAWYSCTILLHSPRTGSESPAPSMHASPAALPLAPSHCAVHHVLPAAPVCHSHLK